MSVSSEYEASLEEKIKLYLDIWVGCKGEIGHNLLDIAKQILFFDMGMDARCIHCKREGKLLALEKRIEIASFVLSKRMSEEDINKELLNLPQSDVKNANEFITEYWKQMRLAIEVQYADRH